MFTSSSVPGEPQTYRSTRPRSTSEAVSTVFRDDLSDTVSKGDHPLTESHICADLVHTSAHISSPYQEDDLDLCPPAPGISTLDFDPMSFQCSPPSAIPGPRRRESSKWRKSAGGSGESEPVSSPNKITSNPRSPDISPVRGKGGKKVPQPLSPKLWHKSCKSPPVVEADVQMASAYTPRWVSGPRDAASSSPPPVPSSSSPPVEKSVAPVTDGRGPGGRCQPGSPLSTASQASVLTDLSQSAQNLPDPGQ